MSYLIGDFSELGETDQYFHNKPRIFKNVTKENLVSAKNGLAQIINLDDLTFFSPARNSWIPLERK